MKSQTAPNVSYATPQNYLLNAAITTLAPVNSGGSVPALTYKQVSTFAGTTTGFLDGTGTAAKMNGPVGMTMDASGNVYFVDNANHRIRKMTSAGVITTIAGDGALLFFSTYGQFKDNADGIKASFNFPTGLVFDATNNCLYVADQFNNRIRKISLTGTYPVTTFAGSGTSNSVDGKGAAASFKTPYGIAIDPSGTYLYVVDETGYKIRRVTISDALVLTIAGSGTASTVDNATGTLATFKDPKGIAVDDNAIYVSDFGGNKIRKIALTAPYAVTTFAGSGVTSSVDGTGVAATFDTPFGITLDGAGNLYVTEWGNKIRKITPTGIVTTIAGSGAASSVDGNGIAATFNNPSGIVINPATGIGYVSEYAGNRIRKIELGGYAISPALPAGLSLDSSTGGITGTPTTINNGPLNYSISAYNYYGSSSTSIAITTGTIPTLTTTVASALTHISTTTGGTVINTGGSTLLERGICWSTNTTPSIVDNKIINGSSVIGSFTSAITGLSPITTYYVRAYATNSVGTAYGTQVSFTTLMTPPSISYTASNTFTVNIPITALETTNIGGYAQGVVSVSNLAGECGQKGMINGQGSAARFSGPMGTATDADGNVYVADKNNNAIRKITADGLVSTYATIIAPIGVATDVVGNVYAISQDSNNKIVKFDPLGNSTIYNNSILGPNAIAIDSVGNMYILDGGLLKKVTPAGVVTIVTNFNYPNAIAIAANGDIFVDEEYKINKITTTGTVSTFLRTGFSYLTSMMIDADGMLYVTDPSDASIKKITPQGVVTTITGHQGNDCDNGTLAVANFNNPSGLSMDSTGNLYVSDFFTNLIRKIALSGFSVNPALPSGLVLNADGSITGTPTVATAATNYTLTAANTGGSSSYTINLTIATVPSLTTTVATSITSTTVTLGGTITSDGYASVNARGVCWSTSPNPTTTDSKTTDGTGTGIFVSAISGLSPVTAYYVRAYATNSVGTVYGNEFSFTTVLPVPIIQYTAAVTYAVNTAIAPLIVTNTGGLVANGLAGVSTFAGSTSGFTNGTTDAKFNQPSDVVKDSNGNLFVTDVSNNAIRKITPSGIVSTFAGGSQGSIDGLGTAAQFLSPSYIAIDTNDNLYVSDTGNHMIRKITPDGLVSTLAGSIYSGNTDGTGTSAQFIFPKGLTLDSVGNVYVADYGNNKIRKITPSGIVTTYFSGLLLPIDVAFNSTGSLFVCQNSTNRIVKLTFPTGLPAIVTYSVITYAVRAFTFDKNDNIYMATAGAIFKSFEPFAAANTNNVAGSYYQGSTDGSFRDAQFSLPNALTIDNEGVLYIADQNNNRIRKISPLGYSVSPALPAGLVLNADGSITGTPTVATAAANYTIKGTNSGGSSSNTLNFAITTIPTLTTTAASAVLATSATAGGNVTSDGYTSVTERGVCWSTSPNPTIADAKTADATGTGTFTSSITGLTTLTTYYVRAYATNSVGTVYGNEIVVNTPMYAPAISYSSPNAFVVNTPITALEVSNIGGAVPLSYVTTLAGTNSVSGSTDGTGSGASFNSPEQMATDSEGTIYLADQYNHRIRKITASGVVTTLAGSTQGDQDGNGVNAKFNFPRGVAVDALGNVYVADSGNNKIKKITSSGDVTTIAGSFQGFLDGTGIDTKFDSPKCITLDASGNLYVTDSYNHKIRKITPAGVVTTFAGSSFGYQEGNGTSSQFYYPSGITIDAAGNFYVADGLNHKIRKITPSGDVTTLAGSTSGILDGTGTAAKFNNPQGICIDAVGNIYVPDFNYQQIRKVTPNGVVTTVAGSAYGNILGQSIDGSILSARFAEPIGIAVGLNGIVYISDRASNVIRKMQLTGFSVSPALPGGLTLNEDGSITGTPTVATAATDYVVTATNSGGSSSYTISFAITTIPSLTTTEASAITATTASLGGTVVSDGYASVNARGVCWSTSPNPTTTDSKTTDGTGTGIFVSAISGLSPVTAYYVRAYATNSVGTVYGNEFSFTTVLPVPIIQYTAAVTYAVNTAITPLAVSNTGGVVINSLAGVSTFAGSTAGYTDGTTNAQFSQPSGVVTDSNGNLFVADSSNNAIRKITPSGTVSTFAGSTAGSADGQGTAAQFFGPDSIAIDANDNLYVSDTGNHLIRKITPSGLVSTLAGTAGTAGFVDGTGTSAQFNTPYGLTLDVSGNVYVADNANNRIRKITPAGVVSTYFVVDYMLRTLDNPLAVAFDSAGNLFVSQFSSNGLVKILVTDSFSELTIVDNSGPVGTITFDTNNSIFTATGGFIIKLQEPYTSGTLFAGGSQGFADGALLEAEFGGIRGLTIDNEGVMYVADGENNRIRKISPFGYLVSPALPAGLILNADGSITGTPTVATVAKDYVVTATNSGGSSSYTLNFAITEAASSIPTWTGTVWINGPATATTPAIIEGNYTPSSSFEVGELTIKNNALVSIRSGVNLTVNGKLTVEPGSDLTFESNSNLLQTTDVANSGVISIKRNTAPLKLFDYVLWSSPVSSQQLQSYSPLTLSNRFYTYNSSTDLYNAVTSPSADSFAAGTGFLIRMPNNHPTTPTIWTGTFTGIPNNGAVNLTVTSGTYNAIGNPYPSTLNANAFIDANGITEALYFWRKTNNSANPSYATYTKAGGVGTANSADPNVLIPNGVIQVGQGFIAKATSNAISFTNAMRTATNGNPFLRTKNTDKSRIWLNLTNASGFFSQAMVAYMDGATSGIDAAIDGRYFNDSKTALTSIINNEEFTIQGRSLPFDASDSVPLGFKAETAGDFSLAIDHTDGLFATEQKVFLKDNVTNTINEISTANYTFTSDAGVFNNRFELVYQKTLGTIDADLLSNQVMVYKQNDKIRIDSGALVMASVKVYDLNGRLIFERKAINANQAVISVVAAEEVLLIKITSNDGIVITKKIIN